MRYIGGKKYLLENIMAEIKKKKISSVIDIFAGSGVVSNCFSSSGLSVISNDILYFSYVLNKGQLILSEKPLYKNLPISNPIKYLNNITIEDTDINKNDCFIWKNYSLHDNCKRMYFQERNALKIDIIRLTIENWKNKGYLSETEYFYLLSRLITAVPFVSNIAGVYAAYLKYWDIRSYKTLELKDIDNWHPNSKNNKVYNLDYRKLLKKESADLLYADPPYNNRQYLPNYHILETISRYDYPTIYGVSGMRKYNHANKSDFCRAKYALDAFDELINLADVDYVIISYNNEGLVSTKELSELCKKYAKPSSFHLKEIPYRRYKCHEKDNNLVCEQLYIFKKQ